VIGSYKKLLADDFKLPKLLKYMLKALFL